MKNLYIFIFLFTVLISKAQVTPKFNIDLKECPLVDAIRFLEKASGVPFSYSSSHLPSDMLVTVNASSTTLEETLDLILDGTPITYKKLDGRMVIRHLPMSQTIRGEIIDRSTRQPLVGATIFVQGINPKKGAVADINGSFVIVGIPLGRHSLQANVLGYEQTITSDIILGIGKEGFVRLEMNQKAVEMDELVFMGDRHKLDPINEMAQVSSRTYTIEEMQRYPAGWGDPQRAASSFAGTMGANDFTNEIIIRGNNPRGILWRVEGMEVPNPNHFSEPGTSSGGIGLLNPNSISRADFYTGAFAPQYGNALSGVFDLQLRPGNHEKHEKMIKAGFIGLELGVEGPTKITDRSSYLVNYRYSTIGVLQALNLLNLGGENTFQDLSLNLAIPTKKAGNFSIYGLGGFSRRLGEEPGYYRKRDYRMGLLGVRNQLPIGKKMYLETSVSGAKNQNIDNLTDDQDLTHESQFDNGQLRGSTFLSYKANSKHVFEIGGIVSRLEYDYQKDHMEFDSLGLPEPIDIHFDEAGHTWTHQGYLSWKYRITNQFTFVNGIHTFHFGLNDEVTFEPRSSIKWSFIPKHSVFGAFGLHSRIESLEY